MPVGNIEKVDRVIKEGNGPDVTLPQKLASEAAQILSGRDDAGRKLDSNASSAVLESMENQLCKVALTSAALKPGDFRFVDSIVPASIVSNGADTEIIFGGDDKHAAPIEIRVHTEKTEKGSACRAEAIHFAPASELQITSGDKSVAHLMVPNLIQEVDMKDQTDAKNKVRSLMAAELTTCIDETTGKPTDSGFGYSLAGTLDNIQKSFGYDATKMKQFLQDTVCPSKFPNGEPSQSADFVASNKIGISNYKVQSAGDSILISNGDRSQTFRWQPKTQVSR